MMRYVHISEFGGPEVMEIKKGTVPVPGKDDVLILAKSADNVARHLENKTIRKEIVVPNKLVNIVVG